MAANLPYGPLINTDNDYYCRLFFLSDTVLVVRYLLGKEEPVLAL